MDNKPFYDKYQVTRTDGEPVGRTLTIEIDKDPQAKQLLMAIADIVGSTRPEFAKSLRDLLRDLGSKAVPGFMKAEGVIVYHEAGNTSFKILLEGDELPKSVAEGNAQ